MNLVQQKTIKCTLGYIFIKIVPFGAKERGRQKLILPSKNGLDIRPGVSISLKITLQVRISKVIMVYDVSPKGQSVILELETRDISVKLGISIKKARQVKKGITNYQPNLSQRHGNDLLSTYLLISPLDLPKDVFQAVVSQQITLMDRICGVIQK
ncbi:MAG: hypothetical protein EZS28_030176 [Streblomastix strix]|uniref:Uncharacterized protein n=1 Tax=Streblomastix strix TaxID=222440 RepID=A0A5J4UUI2_9EUKA|nr:MAG: hypothetical protein EZS28_030176 [Streblomastix strix]